MYDSRVKDKYSTIARNDLTVNEITVNASNNFLIKGMARILLWNNKMNCVEIVSGPQYFP